jgi:hypothetical protein
MNPDNVKAKKAPFYHFNFVSAVLNDLFGIQARGGCMCAAVYAAELLGMTDDQFNAYEDVLVDKASPVCANGCKSPGVIDGNADNTVCDPTEGHVYNVLKPGFTRVSFNYFLPQEEVDFIIDALIWISKNAQGIIPHYDFNPETGQWFSKSLGQGNMQKCRSFNASTTSLFAIFSEGAARKATDLKCPDFKECLELADQMLKVPFPIKARQDIADAKIEFNSDAKAQALKWFITTE